MKKMRLLNEKKNKEKCVLIFNLFDAMFKLKRANYIYCIQIIYIFLYVLYTEKIKLFLEY